MQGVVWGGTDASLYHVLDDGFERFCQTAGMDFTFSHAATATPPARSCFSPSDVQRGKREAQIFRG